MKFGGLSEEEVEKIKAILEFERISFEVAHDTEILEANEASIQNNLRHYRPPNISTHILSITINDNDLDKMSLAGKEELLAFGITDKAPDPEEFITYSNRPKHPVKLKLFHSLAKVLIFSILFILGFIFLNIIFFPKNG